jgi:hypothetical protein
LEVDRFGLHLQPFAPNQDFIAPSVEVDASAEHPLPALGSGVEDGEVQKSKIEGTKRCLCGLGQLSL